MPQDFNKQFTGLSRKRLKNIQSDAESKNKFLETIRPELPPNVSKKLKSIPFIGGAIDDVAKGVTKSIQEPIDKGIKGNKNASYQAWREEQKQIEIQDEKNNPGWMRRVLGVKDDKNTYGKTALGGRNGAYSGQSKMSKLLKVKK